MAKLNTYVPIDKYKNFSNPTTKPFKSSSEGYREKIWTIQEEIQKKLQKADQFIEELISIEESSPNRSHFDKVKGNFELLCNDLGFMENALKNEPFEFNKSNLEDNTSCILEMKETCEMIRKSVVDKVELKKLGKLEHVLTELRHIIEPEKYFSGVSQVGLNEVAMENKRNNALIKKGSAEKMTKKAEPVKKVSTKKKVSVAKPKPKAALTKVAKPKTAVKKPAVKAAAKKTVQASPKRRSAVVKSVTKAKKPVAKAASKPAVKAVSKKKVPAKAPAKVHSKAKSVAKR